MHPYQSCSTTHNLLSGPLKGVGRRLTIGNAGEPKAETAQAHVVKAVAQAYSPIIWPIGCDQRLRRRWLHRVTRDRLQSVAGGRLQDIARRCLHGRVIGWWGLHCRRVHCRGLHWRGLYCRGVHWLGLSLSMGLLLIHSHIWHNDKTPGKPRSVSCEFLFLVLISLHRTSCPIRTVQPLP